jgi:hypothetical protein
MLDIYRVVLEVIRDLRPVLEELRRKSPALHDQLERALTTVVLGIAEGSRSRGRNRPAHYQRGAASMDESIGVIDAGLAFGYLASFDRRTRDKMGHVVGVLVKVSR